jgi:hypothetical protein
MSLRHGTVSNGSYAYTTTLPTGTHEYYFDFRYGGGQRARFPASGAHSGPDVQVEDAVLDVPSEYATLGEAIAYAKGDVIVRLAQGTFNETTPINVSTSGIWIQGAGIDKTIVRGDGTGHVLEVNVDALIRDLTITGGGPGDFESGIWNTSGHVELRNCRFTGNNVGLFTWCFSPDCDAVVTMTNSILDHNARTAVDANDDGVHILRNNTVIANERGIVLNNRSSLAESNIIVHNTGDGLVGNDRSPTVRYNNVWGNGVNYGGVSVGTGDQTVDPRFVSESTGDYRLQIGSPCLDAGNPDSTYNDRNGGRNDMGAYGGPYALQVILSQADSPPFARHAFTVSWQGYASDGIQSHDAQFQIGKGGAWTDWLIRTPSTSAQFGPTDPIHVMVGTTYCFRTRARDWMGRVEDYPSQADTCTRLGELIYLPVTQK